MARESSPNVPSSLSHRLATVSASQALQTLRARGPRSLSTGLEQLDDALRRHGTAGQALVAGRGGLARGQVTEIYGPPGVGKTTFGIQACASALRAGDDAVWIGMSVATAGACLTSGRTMKTQADARPDASTPLSTKRLNDIVNANNGHSTFKEEPGSSAPKASPSTNWQDRFHYHTTPTLAHLLALFVHPPAAFPPRNAGIIVIDSLSTLFDNAYPRHTDDRRAKTAPASKVEAARWAAGRKHAVLGELMSQLCKIAALRDLVILITCQSVTRMRPGGSAPLVPAVSGPEWDNGVATKLVLFRDWPPAQGLSQNIEPGKLSRLRFVGVEKAGAAAQTLADDRFGNVIAFTIEDTGPSDSSLTSPNVAMQHLTSPARPVKRSYAEIADSEDEDPDSDELYGWAEEDELAAEGLVINESAIVGESVRK